MIKMVREMWWFIKKNPQYYLSILFFGFLQSFVNLIPMSMIDNFVSKIESGDIINSPDAKAYMLYYITIGSILVAILVYLVITTRRVIQNRLKVKLFYALQVRYMQNIIIQDAEFFGNYKAGDLLTRALGDVRQINFSGGNRLLIIIFEMASIVTYTIYMCTINWFLAIVSIAPLSIIFVANVLLRVKVKDNWKKVRDASSEMGNVVLESITNVRTIRAFSKEEENYQKNLIESKKVYDIERKNLKINVLFMPIYQTITAFAVIIAYSVASLMILNDYKLAFGITASSLVTFTLALNKISGPLTKIGNILTNFYQSLISLDRLNEIYNSKSAIVDIDGAKKLKSIKKIEFKNMVFKYSNDLYPVINGISFTLNEGETLGIVGRTGSGKSTLVRQFLRQFVVESGQIFINGIDINEYEKESIRQRVGYVPQEHMLFSRTVIQNVELGSTELFNKDDVFEAIDMADFRKDIENLPVGLDTMVGEYGVTLSGGQKQRLSIARAFMKKADLMILDDSLSAVDGKTEANIIQNLKKHRSNKTNIIVAHRLSAVMHATKIIVLDNGKIIESGTHEELMNLGGWYKELFLEQQMTKDGDLDE